MKERRVIEGTVLGYQVVEKQNTYPYAKFIDVTIRIELAQNESPQSTSPVDNRVEIKGYKNIPLQLDNKVDIVVRSET